MTDSKACDFLIEQLAAYGIEISDEQASLIVRHIHLVIEKNKVTNLTRITSLEDALVLHDIDSLLLVRPIKELLSSKESVASFVDIGTGAGFPGVPLGIVTGHDGVLIDSVQKKTDAVNEFIRDLCLEGTLAARHVRAEELGLEEPRNFDYAVARAVARLDVLMEYATPLLRDKGFFIATKAILSDEETSACDIAAELCGLESVSRETLELPQEAGHREILVYKKTDESKIKLPRRSGMATKRPLGDRKK